MKKDYLKNVNVEDELWSSVYGWGVVCAIDNKSRYPISMKFKMLPGYVFDYNYSGYYAFNSILPSLFFTGQDFPDKLFKKN